MAARQPPTRRPARITARDPRAGFTLIEALVALAVLALLLIVLSGGFQLVLRQAELEASAAALRAGAAGREAIVRQLAVTVPVAFRRSDSDAIGRGLVGEADRVEFVTRAPLAMGGLLVAALRLRPAPSGGHDLVLVTRPLDLSGAGRSAVAPADVSVLSKDVRALQLRYFGAAAGGAGPLGWHAEWHAAQLPDLVEITVHATASRSGPRSDVIVVAPRQSRLRHQ